MFSTKYFIDEKFKDTIKKNSCRLRQKSSVQIGILKEQAPTHTPIQNEKEKENKEFLCKNKTIERNRTPNNKLLNFTKSIYSKKNNKNDNESNKEEKQILVKKKISEECTSSIKQRILTKLKEKRNENINKIVKNENKNDNNDIIQNKTIPRDILVNRKKYNASTDIDNIIYRNKKCIEKRNIPTTINNDEDKNESYNISNNKTNLTNENKGIYSLKNIKSKNINNNNFSEGRYSNSNIYIRKNGINKDKLNRINENNKNSLIKKNWNNFNNNYENDKNISQNYDINDKNDNNNDKNEDKKNNNDIIIVHKKSNYFNKRYNLIKKKEEEKSKNYNDEIQKTSLNKTASKPDTKYTFINDLQANRFSTSYNRKKFKDIQTSIKLSVNKSPAELINDCEYNLTSTISEQNENKRLCSHYLSTEKPRIFSKSTLFKNLMINTDDNGLNKYKETEISKKNIFKNNIKQNAKDLNNRSVYLNNNDNLSCKSNLSNREKSGISELLKSDKKNYRQTNIKKNLSYYSIYNYDYVMKMINEAIQLKNSIEIQSLFSILLINFNNKYLATFDYKDFPKEIPQFSICYKYFSVFIIPLIFLHKDESIYKNSSSDAKDIFETFIYVCIENIGQKNLLSKKIDLFIEEYKKNGGNKEKKDMEECCNDLIKIIFKNFKEYSPLKKATEQLLSFVKKEPIEKIINIINDTILYCFNHKQKNSFFLLEQKITGNRNKSFYQIPGKELNKTISAPTTPFIRCAMKKNFCLVLDIDETIVHSCNLPFGNYFLLRPGVINFLEEISKLYEIIIFTSSPKNYADGILNKIDINNNYFSHRLYKDHVIFEKGKSVKKLNMIGRELNKIIFVDNMKSNAKYNLQNLCHVSTWIHDINDQEIIKLKIKLKYIATNRKYKDDIRKGLEYCI